jgi:anthranilate phosphoribosyltransferase
MVKGLEGSVDLPTNRPVIVKTCRDGVVDRLPLNPQDVGIKIPDYPFEGLETWTEQAIQGLTHRLPPAHPLGDLLRWNGGFYLWQSGLAPSLEAGMMMVVECLASGAVFDHLQRLRVSLQG